MSSFLIIVTFRGSKETAILQTNNHFSLPGLKVKHRKHLAYFSCFNQQNSNSISFVNFIFAANYGVCDNF